MRKQSFKKNSQHVQLIDDSYTKKSGYVPLSEVNKLVDAIVSVYDLEKKYFPKNLSTPQIEHIELFDIRKIELAHSTLGRMSKKYPIEELLLLEEKATAIYKLLIGESQDL